GGELGVLQLRIGCQAAVLVTARQLEHAVIEAVEACEGNELEFVTHRAQLALEAGDGCVVEVSAPVEGRRAVVGKQLAGKLAMDRGCELARLVEVGTRGLPPQQIGVTREGETALDAVRETGPRPQPVE